MTTSWLIVSILLLAAQTIPVTQARLRVVVVPPPIAPSPVDDIVNKKEHHEDDAEDERGAHDEGTWLSWGSSSWDDDDNRMETTFLQGAEALLLQTGGNVHIIVHCTEELERIKEVMLQEGISASSVSFHIQKPSPGYDDARRVQSLYKTKVQTTR
jgi:hypothetical protein